MHNNLLTLGTPIISFFFFFNDTATTEIYTLSLHDALPIYLQGNPEPIEIKLFSSDVNALHQKADEVETAIKKVGRSEEHTSELQSRPHLVCRLLLEKKIQ